MSARFAELCREKPLDLDVLESANANNSQRDGRKLKDICLVCERDLYLGVFFDGTNNNKYRDLPNDCGSNIARLFEAFIGSPSAEIPSYGGTPSKPLKSKTVLPQDFPFYRKIYIPGLGTACPEVCDKGEGGDKTRGLAFAAQGEARIWWALLQALNQVHYMFAGCGFDALTKPFSRFQQGFQAITPAEFEMRLRSYNQTLADRLAPWRAQSPLPRVLRLSVFGFSRGAAEARAFVNQLLRSCGSQIGGIPLKIDMLGLFDTVASVGAAHITSVGDGHMAWADGENMVIPSSVRRCVHLVSAHEVRMCFPLDSVGQGGHIPNNCKEIVYPGVHSDVGGGYGLNDQGRCPSDADKISQITLAQMYREARMAAVPLAAPADMPGDTFKRFAISDTLKADFNAYVEKTRGEKQDPGLRDGMERTLCPSETQPPERLETLMHRHYEHYLAWRKFRLDDVHQLPGLKDSVRNKVSTAKQDIYDIWQTNELLKEELKPSHLSIMKPLFNMANGADAGFTATRDFWNKAALHANTDQALIRLFDLYVHDSRAWFKFGAESDDEWFGGGKDAKGAPRTSKKEAYRASLAKQREAYGKMAAALRHTNPQGAVLYEEKIKAIDKETALYEKWGDTLQAQGKSWQEMLYLGAGYLRWRTIYSTGDSRRDARQVQRYDMCVLNREVNLASRKKEAEKLQALRADRMRITENFLNNGTTQLARIRQNGHLEETAKFERDLSETLKLMDKQNEVLDTRIRHFKKQLSTTCDAS